MRAVSTRSARPSPPRVAFLILAILAVCAAPARADDNGWSRLAAGPRVVPDTESLAVAVDGTVYAAGNGTLFASDDAGSSWRPTGDAYGDPVPDPFDPQRLYTIFVTGERHERMFVTPTSDDGGRSWQNMESSVTAEWCRSEHLVVDPSTPGRLYLFTSQREGGLGEVRRSDDYGHTWTLLTVPYHPRAVVVDAGGTVYLPTAGHGVLRSEDAGATWSIGSAGIAHEPDGRQIVTQVVASPSDPGVSYALATGGLYRTMDEGAHWTLSTASPPASIRDLQVDPTDSGVLWAQGYLGSFDWRLIRSDDGGTTWSVAYSSPDDVIPSIVLDPTRAGRMYAPSTAPVADDPEQEVGVMRSTDGGATWSEIDDGLLAATYLDSFALSASDSQVVYGLNYDGFYRTSDGGETWTRNRATAGRPYLTVVPGTPDVLLAYDRSFGKTVLRSGDGGATWQAVTSKRRVRQIVAVGHGKVFAVWFGSPYVSTDAGLSWKRVPAPRGVDQVVADHGSLRYVLAGAHVFARAGDGWRLLAGLPYAYTPWIAGDPSDPNILYVRTWDRNGRQVIDRTLDGGRHWVDVRPSQTLGPYDQAALIVDSHDPRVLYLDSGAPAKHPILLRSTDRGLHWFVVPGDVRSRWGFSMLPGSVTRLAAVRVGFPSEGQGDIDVYTPVDTDAPWFSVQPVAHVRLGAVLGSSVPLAESWHSLDHTSSVTAYHARRTDGDGAARALAEPHTASIAYTGSPGARVLVDVQGVDHAGNASVWRGTAVTPWVDGDSNPALRYSRGWAVDRSAVSTGGQTHRTNVKGASVRFTFTGRGIAWVGARGSLRGSAGIAIDGVHAASVNLHAPAFAPRRVLFSKAWPAGGVHTLTIACTGGGTIDLDSLIVLR